MKRTIFRLSPTVLICDKRQSKRSYQQILIYFVVILFLSSCDEANTITEKEIEAGWQLLFDGKTLDGWKQYNRDCIGPMWRVENGSIIFQAGSLAETNGESGGSLITTRHFGNFELTLDWKISPGSNSGILYHVAELPEFKYDHETGPEFQVADDTWTFNKEVLAGSCIGMFAVESSKSLASLEWNTARIVYDNGQVEHWLNGEKVVEYVVGSPDYNQRLASSQWKDLPGWNRYTSGAISLQDHGQTMDMRYGETVFYRNIKIRELPAADESKD
jgi:hypothetical protein